MGLKLAKRRCDGVLRFYSHILICLRCSWFFLPRGMRDVSNCPQDRISELPPRVGRQFQYTGVSKARRTPMRGSGARRRGEKGDRSAVARYVSCLRRYTRDAPRRRRGARDVPLALFGERDMPPCGRRDNRPKVKETEAVAAIEPQNGVSRKGTPFCSSIIIYY